MRIIGYLPVAFVAITVALVAPGSSSLLVWWIVVTVLVALATTFINPLKCLGSGHLYMFAGVVPSALCIGTLMDQGGPGGKLLGALGVLVNCLAVHVGFKRVQRSAPTSKSEFAEVISKVSKIQAKRAAVLPCVFADELARHTNLSVLWGGHSLGFKRLEPYWPVLREPLLQILNQYEIDVALIKKSWSESCFARLAAELLDSGVYTTRDDIGDWAVFVRSTG